MITLEQRIARHQETQPSPTPDLLWPQEVESRLRDEAWNMDEQELPSKVIFCKRCVVSNQRPRIVFDDEGICSACRYAEYKDKMDRRVREQQFREMLERHRRPTGYDVIVPCSGGKDSSMVAHRLKHDYDMHPLCVKWAPFAYTDVGLRNFQSFVHAGFDVLVAWPNGNIHRKLSRLAFEYLGDAWQPFTFGQLCYPMQMARRFGISLVMFGENGEAEYGGDPAANDKPCWDYADWDRVYLKGANVDRLVEIGTQLGAISGAEKRDVSEFYRMPPAARDIEFHWFGYYHHWTPQENYMYACEHTSFECNPGRSEGTYSKYASLDDRFDGLHYYMAFIKFGIGRCTSDAAHEIRDRHITRDEAIALVTRFDGEFPKKHFHEFLVYLGMDEDRFWQVVDRWRRPQIWHHRTEPGHLVGEWHLNEPIWKGWKPPQSPPPIA